MSHRSRSLVPGFVLGLAMALGLTQLSLADDPKEKSEAKPPAGWKEHSPGDGTYVVWIPEKANRQSERTRTINAKGAQLKINMLTIQFTNGPSYIVEEGILSPNLSKKFSHTELEDIFRDEIASIVGGKITDDTEVKAGNVTGKEFRIEGKTNARARVFVTPNNSRIFLLRVTGTKEHVDGENAKTFLESGRLTAANNNSARGPRIQGGGKDPEFKDAAPKDGVLVGVEVGLGQVFNSDIVKAVRPVYRVGEKESLGIQYGTPSGDAVKVIAKPGYAVGSLMVKSGLTVDGFSIKFMKLTDGKLDPKDSYESEWIGGKGGGGPVKIGDGTLVVGLLGRTNGAKDVTGLGLLYKEAEKPAAPEKK
jgi:hypothetical protein